MFHLSGLQGQSLQLMTKISTSWASDFDSVSLLVALTDSIILRGNLGCRQNTKVDTFYTIILFSLTENERKKNKGGESNFSSAVTLDSNLYRVEYVRVCFSIKNSLCSSTLKQTMHSSCRVGPERGSVNWVFGETAKCTCAWFHNC